MSEPLTISIGRRKANTGAEYVKVLKGEDIATALVAALRDCPADLERWWSVHTWSSGRKSDGWKSSCGVGVDLDWMRGPVDGKGRSTHGTAPIDKATELQQLAREGKIPGSVFHLTPGGARIIFLFDRQVTDRATQMQAAKGAILRVRQAVTVEGYEIDEAASSILTGYLWTPTSIVGGIKRQNEVLILRPQGFDPTSLIAPESAPARVMTLVTPGGMDIAKACDLYNATHARELPRNSGQCPVCGHKGCFGFDGKKWACFSANHPEVGKRFQSNGGATGWCGDLLDLDAHAQGTTPAELLRSSGFLVSRNPPPVGPAANVTEISTGTFFRSGSYGSVVSIIRNPELRKVVLGAGDLELNELSLSVTLDREPLSERNYLQVRERCETRLSPNEAKGYKFSRNDVADAISQVALEHKYHPVSEYIARLSWDGVERISQIGDMVFQVGFDSLRKVLVRKWLISAIARVKNPGCQADGVLIELGPDGAGKSSFYRILGGEWFRDTGMDLDNKDSYQQCHGAWIYEWAEMDSMSRARSIGLVNAFVTSCNDNFRPPYGRTVESFLRRFVLCGSTNNWFALTGQRGKGNRRYWLIPAPVKLRLDWLKDNRDQIWAEAKDAYSRGEIWHLTDSEDVALKDVQDAHIRSDPWEARIRGWLGAQKIHQTSTGSVLFGAIDKPAGNWTHTDEIRVATVLEKLGWVPSTSEDGSSIYVDCRTLPF